MYRDKLHVMSFLMALSSDCEPVHASFHYRETFPHLENVVAELFFEETRLGILKKLQSYAMTHTSVLPLCMSPRLVLIGTPSTPDEAHQDIVHRSIAW